MSTTIANISFDGSLVDFIDTIAQTGVPISPRGLVDIHENMSVDRYTRVKVEERGQRVRDLITNSIDLRTRPRVVWIARTELGAKSTTFIQYLRKASR